MTTYICYQGVDVDGVVRYVGQGQMWRVKRHEQAMRKSEFPARCGDARAAIAHWSAAQSRPGCREVTEAWTWLLNQQSLLLMMMGNWVVTMQVAPHDENQSGRDFIGLLTLSNDAGR